MSTRARPLAPSRAQFDMLQAARDSGDPFATGYSGGRENVFRALCRAGYLDPETGVITKAGRSALARMEAGQLKVAK